MGARHPSWSDLEVFLATARGGTLAAAGEALHVDASTVQRRVGKLEKCLGTRLFDRTQRGYSLTPAGEDLLQHTLAMEREVLAVSRAIRGRDQSLDGPVRVATVDDLAVTVLSPILRDFRKKHRRVTVHLGIRADFEDLGGSQTDVALRFGVKPSAGDLIVKHVSRVDMALYASRAYLRARGRPGSLDQLAAHPIVRSDGRLSGHASERIVERYGDRDMVALRSNSMLARVVAIRDGIGIGLIPCFMGERERTLERIDLREEAFADLWMIVHADLRRHARVRAFVDFAYDALVAQRPWFEHPRARQGPRASLGRRTD